VVTQTASNGRLVVLALLAFRANEDGDGTALLLLWSGFCTVGQDKNGDEPRQQKSCAACHSFYPAASAFPCPISPEVKSAGPSITLLLSKRRPAEAYRDGRFIILALIHIDGAAVIESEYLVCEVFARDKKRESIVDTEADLGVKLEVRV
jgi:hypothetical protein